MSKGSTFDAKMASVGLVAAVGLVWGLLSIDGSLDQTWMMTGFLTVGLGMLVINGIDRVAERVSSEAAVKAAGPAPKAVEAGDEAAVESDALGPRMWVLMVASCLEAVAVGLLAGYYSGSMIVLVAAGLIAGALAVGITLLLAKKLTPA